MKEKKNTDKHGQEQTDDEGLIPRSGGYRDTKTWNLAELIYDVTVLFCDKYIDRRSRTHDQMVQSGRSGTRNLSEGSVDSGTSKKIEMKLTGIALGSLDELSRDFSSFLRHHGLPEWPPDHPALTRFKALRCATLQEFRVWVADEVKRAERERMDTDPHGRTQTDHRPAVLAANGALSLLNLCMYLVKQQLEAQAKAFEKEGGFTERLYRRRTERRQEENR